MKVALYARVSTEGRKNPDGTKQQGQTVDPQFLEMRAYCDRQGWPVVAEFSDVMSGLKDRRPGLDAMLAAVERGEIDLILIVKLDRLGRSLLRIVKLIDQLGAMGCGVICTSQAIDTRKDSPMGRMVIQIMSVFAEFERNIIAERTRAGLAVARANGKVLGRPSKALEGVDVEAVVALWEDECGGVGYRELARRLGGVSPMTARMLARS